MKKFYATAIFHLNSHAQFKDGQTYYIEIRQRFIGKSIYVEGIRSNDQRENIAGRSYEYSDLMEFLQDWEVKEVKEPWVP